MNSLSFKISNDGHKKAQVTVVDKPAGEQKFPYFGGGKDARQAEVDAFTRLKGVQARNNQVRNDLGIEFTYTYKGLKASEHGKDWYGDVWEITGKGDFKMTYKTGVGHRLCFWGYGMQDTLHALIVPPSALDILSCVQRDDPRDETFETWCDELGYDADSKKAEKIYRACEDQTKMFRRNYYDIDLDDYEPLENY